MKQRTNIVTAMIMEMCMWTYRMCKTCYAHLSDAVSVSRVTPCAA